MAHHFKSFAIAAREYNAAVKTKAFVISVVLLPIMLFATFIMQHFTEHLADSKNQRYVFIDHGASPDLFSVLNAAVNRRNASGTQPAWLLERSAGGGAIDQLRYKLSDRVRHGELAGFIEVNGDSIIYHSSSPTSTEFRDFAGRHINEALRSQRLANAGFPGGENRASAHAIAGKRFGGLARLDSKTGSGGQRNRPMGLPPSRAVRLVMLMFLVVHRRRDSDDAGVIEEKQQRIAEVLLASVRPFQLMAGKLIGMTPSH
jgi:ABC-2 type transport system permease protein